MRMYFSAICIENQMSERYSFTSRVCSKILSPETKYLTFLLQKPWDSTNDKSLSIQIRIRKGMAKSLRRIVHSPMLKLSIVSEKLLIPAHYVIYFGLRIQVKISMTSTINSPISRTTTFAVHISSPVILVEIFSYEIIFSRSFVDTKYKKTVWNSSENLFEQNFPFSFGYFPHRIIVT